jgi:nucleolar protein 15
MTKKAPKPVADPPTKVDETTEKPAKRAKKVKAPEFVEGTPKIMKKSTVEKFGMKESEVAELIEKTKKIEAEAQLNEKESSLKLEKVKVKRKSSEGKAKKADESKIFMSLENEANDNKTLEEHEKEEPPAERSNSVIMLKHIPHGFYEDEMKAYFSQFGKVTNLRLARSHKTGRSKGFAYVEFKYKDIAEIVAETMNNYLMYNCILKCKVLPEEKCHPRMFNQFKKPINPNHPPLMTKRVKLHRIHNSNKSDESNERKKEKILEKIKKQTMKLKDLGISFEPQITY